MARKKVTTKALATVPAQMKQDVKTVAGVLDRWATEFEDLTKDVFGWVKKHKLLAAVVLAVFFGLRYLWGEPEKTTKEEDY